MTGAQFNARFALVAVVFGVLSCRAPVPARQAVAKRAPVDETVSAGDILTPDNVPLPQTCTPTGPELCFDATDNNCNGVIDEGCGVQTGPLQFAIAWPEGANVDLEVKDPNGEQAKPGERTGAGLVKDRDCGRPQNVCHGQNMENVYFAGDRPFPGSYRVEIKVDKTEEAHFPVTVRFGGRVGSKTFGRDVEIKSPDDSQVFTIPVR